MRRLALGCALLGLVGIVGGALALQHDDPPARAAAAAPTADVGTVPTAPTAPASTPRAPVGPLPADSRLRLPRLGVDARITGVEVRDHVMQVPRDPHVVGLWRDGAQPGSGRGSVVVVGHVNYAGTSGALGVLPKARPGDRVLLGPRTYRVSAARTYPKTSGIPDSAFATGGRERLVLITCGGPFDPSTGNYVDNVVVYAVPA